MVRRNALLLRTSPCNGKRFNSRKKRQGQNFSSNTQRGSESRIRTERSANVPLKRQESGDQTTLHKKLAGLARRGKARACESLLQDMIDSGVHQRESFRTTLHAWLRSGDPESPKNAETLINRMGKLASSTGRMDLKPSNKELTTVISCWATQKDSTNAQRVLMDMVHEYESGEDSLKPDTVTFNAILDAHANTDNAQAAEAVLEQMEALHHAGNKDVQPNTISYNTTLKALMKSSEIDAAERAEKLLRSLEVRPDVELDATSYSTVMKCFVKLKTKKGAEFAEHILRHMKIEMQPTAQMFAIAIDGYANVGMVDKAEEIWAYMLSRNVEPTVVCCNTVLKAFARSSKVTFAAERAEVLLSRMECRDVVSYNIVLDCWAKSRAMKAPKRAEALFDHMIKHTIYNAKSFHTLMNAHASVGNAIRTEELLDDMIRRYESGKGKNQNLKPTAYSFNILLKAWSRCNYPRAGERAEATLTKMETLERWNIQPSAVSYGTTISCFAKQGAGGDHADRLLSRMKERGISTNTIIMSSIMDVHATSGNVERCQELLRSLLADFNASGKEDTKPNIVCFNTVLKAFARSRRNDAPLMAMEFLQEMERQPVALGVKPDIFSYNTVLRCWSVSRQQDAAIQAENMLWAMERFGNIQPDTRSFNMVLSACAQVGDSAKATNILEKMGKLSDGGTMRPSPSAVSYKTVLKAWLRSDFGAAQEQATTLLKKITEVSAFPSRADPASVMLVKEAVELSVRKGVSLSLSFLDAAIDLCAENRSVNGVTELHTTMHEMREEKMNCEVNLGTNCASDQA